MTQKKDKHLAQEKDEQATSDTSYRNKMQKKVKKAKSLNLKRRAARRR